MILVESADQITIIRLNRPEKRNAMTPLMLSDLAAAIVNARNSGAIVISGVGDVFCAGFDLALCRDDRRVLRDLLTGLSECLMAMRETMSPIVLSAHGAAVAGGCALLAGADFVYTDASAKLGYPVLKLGISPAVNIPFLRSVLSDGQVRAKTLEPELFTAMQARAAGLVHEVTENAAACEAASITLAKHLASKPAWALQATKRWLEEVAPVTGIAEGLAASLGLVDGEEEREMLPKAWTRK